MRALRLLTGIAVDDGVLESASVPATLDEMPFHARLSGTKLSETPLGKIIFEHEAQVVADHDAGRITDAEFDAFYQKASDSLSRLYDLNHRSVEEDKEFREVTAEADTRLEALTHEKLGGRILPNRRRNLQGRFGSRRRKERRDE